MKVGFLPAFAAALANASSMRSCAGSFSGYKVMKKSTLWTASSLVKYWQSPSEDAIKNLSLGLNVQCLSEGEHVIYGESPLQSTLNVSSTALLYLGCPNKQTRINLEFSYLQSTILKYQLECLLEKTSPKCPCHVQVSFYSASNHCRRIIRVFPPYSLNLLRFTNTSQN